MSTGMEVAVPFGGGGIALTQNARMDGAGLTIAEGVTEVELVGIAEGLGMINDAACFAVGDIANFLKEHFPAEYRQWVDREKPVKNLDRKTVLVYAAVCKAFPHDVRVRFLTDWPGLSFSHFSRVRRYGRELAEYWLQRACDEQLSLNDLTELLDAGTPGSDDVPAAPENPDSVFGQPYWLGPPEDPCRHLLLCGDATLPEHLAVIQNMGGKASMMWTDPPYGVDYVGKTEEALTIQNDAAEDLDSLLPRAWAAASPWLEDAAPFYVAGPTGDNAASFLQSFKTAGWRYKQMLVWVKNVMVLGRQDHQLQHEGIYYGNAPSVRIAGRMSGESYRWYGGDNVTSVFFVDKPAASREHPTMKPVKLILPAIENSSRPGEIVLDPFAGSGSTLIAADQMGRRCFAIEYDPAYADVIQRRYAKYLETRAALGIKSFIESQAAVVPDYGPGPLDGEA